METSTNEKNIPKNSKLSFFDFSAIQPRLYVFGEEYVSTKFGIVIGILTCLAIFILCGYFAISTFSRSSLTLIYNQDSAIYPVINMSEYPLTLSLLDNYGKLIEEQDRVFNFYVTIYNFLQYMDEKGQPQAKTFLEEIKLEKCDLDKHFGKYRSYFADFADMSSKYCLPSGKKNITLYGVYGNLKNGYNFLDIFINRCVNNSLTNPNNLCKDKKYIQDTLSNSYLQIGYMDYDIDNKNETHPGLVMQRSDIIPVSSTVYKRIFNYKKPIQYKTDYGYVFEDTKTDYFFQEDRKESQVDLRTEGPIAGSFAEITILSSAKTDIYNRSYAKLQALLANIGGIIKGVMFMASIFTYLYSQKNLTLTLFNTKEFVIGSLEEFDKLKKNIAFNNPHKTYEKLADVSNNNIKSIGQETKEVENITKPPEKNGKLTSIFGMNKNGLMKEKFNLTFTQMVLPFFLTRAKPKYKIYANYDSLIKRTLSIDNILEKFSEVERMVITYLNELNHVSSNQNQVLINNLIDNSNIITKKNKDQPIKVSNNNSIGF